MRYFKGNIVKEEDARKDDESQGNGRIEGRKV